METHLVSHPEAFHNLKFGNWSYPQFQDYITKIQNNAYRIAVEKNILNTKTNLQEDFTITQNNE